MGEHRLRTMHALRGQGELRGISISPFAPLTPTPLKTSRDTLHLETGAATLTIALRGAFGGWGYDGERKTVNKKM